MCWLEGSGSGARASVDWEWEGRVEGWSSSLEVGEEGEDLMESDVCGAQRERGWGLDSRRCEYESRLQQQAPGGGQGRT